MSELDGLHVSGGHPAANAVIADALDRLTTGKDIGPTALINALTQAQREIDRLRRLFDPEMLWRMEAWERSQLDVRPISGGPHCPRGHDTSNWDGARCSTCGWERAEWRGLRDRIALAISADGASPSERDYIRADRVLVELDGTAVSGE